MTSSTNYTPKVVLEQNRANLEKSLRVSRLALIKHALLSSLQRSGAALITALTAGDRPRIKGINRAEGKVWKVFDPITNQKHFFESEAGLRTWLEQRYYLN